MQRSDDVSPFAGFGHQDTDKLLLNMRVPLYQSGAEYSRIREAQNNAERAKYDRQGTDNAVTETVHRAWEDYRSANAVITATEEAINAAGVALKGVREEQQHGVRTTLDVLDAEQELFGNRVSLVRAQRDQCVNAYRLLAAVGRLTAKELALNVEIHDPEAHYEAVREKFFGF